MTGLLQAGGGSSQRTALVVRRQGRMLVAAHSRYDGLLPNHQLKLCSTGLQQSYLVHSAGFCHLKQFSLILKGNASNSSQLINSSNPTNLITVMSLTFTSYIQEGVDIPAGNTASVTGVAYAMDQSRCCETCAVSYLAVRLIGLFQARSSTFDRLNSPCQRSATKHSPSHRSNPDPRIDH